MIKQLGNDEKEEKVIKEIADIIKFTFVCYGRKNKNRKPNVFGKKFWIDLREKIGFKPHDAWCSRDWVFPAYRLAFSTYYKISTRFDLLYPVAYFNLLWFQKLPNVICDIIIDYLDRPQANHYFTCVYCKTQLKNKINFERHLNTKTHKERADIVSIPKYLIGKTYLGYIRGK